MELVHLEDLRLNGNAAVVYVEVADDDEVCIEGLGDADGGGAAGLEVLGKAEMIERKEEIVTGNGEEANGAEALVERIGERVAYPGEIGLTGPVVEGQDEDETSAGRSRVRAGAVLGRDCLLDAEDAGEEKQRAEQRPGTTRIFPTNETR